MTIKLRKKTFGTITFQGVIFIYLFLAMSIFFGYRFYVQETSKQLKFIPPNPTITVEPTQTPTPTQIYIPSATPIPVAPKEPGGIIIWSPGRKLTWEDFQGSVQANANGEAALSNIGIGVSNNIKPTCVKNGDYQCTIVITNLSVSANFNKASSWVNLNSKTSDILAHEQLHFDIAELYSRKMKTEMLIIGAQSSSSANPGAAINEANKYLNAVIDEVYNRVAHEHDTVQAQYDNETSHGTNSGAQNSWEQKIRGALERT